MKNSPPETLVEFQERFASDADCEEYLLCWRWPDGFRCPRCDARSATKLSFRRQYQCHGCRYQVSVTAGTVLHKSKVALHKWFWAIFLVARHKKGISALQLQRDLGIGSYETAWLMLHKIRRCFGEKAEYPLKDVVEVDETLIGAKEKGAKPGKAAQNKAIVIGAVQLGERRQKGHRWAGARLARIDDYSSKAIGDFVRSNITEGTHLMTDGWRAYGPLEKQGYERTQDLSSAHNKASMRKHTPMRHVHLLFSNLKTWLRGRFHGVSHKYLPWYLDEFIYRLNRRHSPTDLFGWVCRRMVTQTPCPMAHVKAAGSSG